MAEKAIYTHGHHSSVVTSHSRRTAQDSAAFLIPHIKPTSKILDLGCGPGSITIGLAKLVPQGSVIGGDAVDEVLTQARSLADSQSITNLTFQKMDGNALPFPDNSFDIAYCHQLLQHVADPVGMLREMRRVTKSGTGIVAARDADYKSFAWMPEDPELDMWNELYRKLAKANGAEPNAGRYLKLWARQAGFAVEDVVYSWNVWNYQGDAAKAFARSWVDRTLHSAFAKQVVEKGFADQEVLERISRAWARLAEAEDGFLVIPNGEILCFVR